MSVICLVLSFIPSFDGGVPISTSIRIFHSLNLVEKGMNYRTEEICIFIIINYEKKKGSI